GPVMMCTCKGAQAVGTTAASDAGYARTNSRKSKDFQNNAHRECAVDSGERSSLLQLNVPRSEFSRNRQPGTDREAKRPSGADTARRNARRLCPVLLHAILSDAVQHQDGLARGTTETYV